jgi:hypothetical protein
VDRAGSSGQATGRVSPDDFPDGDRDLTGLEPATSYIQRASDPMGCKRYVLPGERGPLRPRPTRRASRIRVTPLRVVQPTWLIGRRG